MHTSRRRPITRNRELLACTECRRRKLKCDRNVPCGSCVRRDDAASCIYQRLPPNERERERRIEAESRLEHLEGLVQQLAASQATKSDPASAASSTHQIQEQVNTPLALRGGSVDFPYSGDTHWSAMLEDIDELRFSISAEDDNHQGFSPGFDDDDPVNFLFGAATPLPFERILFQCSPSRQEADIFIAAYFRSKSVVAPFIHAAQFYRRYQQFWKSPKDAPPLWTAMLFLVYYISSTAVKAPSAPASFESKYLLAAAQCLAVGRYHKPQPFAVESLLLFAQSRCFRGLDITSDLGMIMASVIRLATSSGYHIDPEMFSLSAFEKEMRRRTWSLCKQLDLLISFALGLPSNLPVSTRDTHPPRNLLDSDFDENTKELPESRPDSEATNILFYIAKHRLMTVFEKILRHSLTLDTSLPIDPDGLETELKEAYSALPAILKPRSVAESVVDTSTLVVTRLCLLFLYQKCRCVLHRKYAVHGREESLEICYDASWSIVGYFVDVFPNLQVAGQFEHERWFNSTLTWHDFLLGIMVLCLVLCVESGNNSRFTIDYAGSRILLLRAQEICTQVSFKSRYTGRVQKLIQGMLLHLDKNGSQQKHTSSTNGQILSEFTVSPSSLDTRLLLDGVNPGSVNGVQQCTTPLNDNVWTAGWDETTLALDDISWQYLDQFLNLPNGDAMMEL